MPERLEGRLYLALTMVLVSNTMAVSKIIAANLPPFTVTTLCFVVTLPLSLLITRMTHTRWPAFAHRDWALFLV